MTLRSIFAAVGAEAPAIERALAADADAVLVDLRSPGGVGGPALRGASALLRPVDGETARAGLWLRLPSPDDIGGDTDLSTLSALRPDGFVLSAAQSGADIEHLGARLAVAEADVGLDDGSLRIIGMVETAGAVFELHRMARASPRLAALMWDGEALARDLGADEDRDMDGRWIDPLQTIRTLLLAACADAKLPAIDSPFTDGASAIFRKETERAARDGFAGKCATTSEQAAVVAEIFRDKR